MTEPRPDPWTSDPDLTWTSGWVDLPELAARWPTFVRQYVATLPADADVVELRIRRSTDPAAFRVQAGFRPSSSARDRGADG